MKLNKLTELENRPQSHRSGRLVVSLGFWSDASDEDIQNEIDNLRMMIEESIDEAIEQNRTTITGVHFE